MLEICLVFWKSEPQYAYKRYAYKKNMQVEKIPKNGKMTSIDGVIRQKGDII